MTSSNTQSPVKIYQQSSEQSTQVGQMYGGNIFAGTGDVHYNVNTPSPTIEEEHRNLLILLDKVKQFWVEGVLEKSVHHAVLIELGKISQHEKVEHPWEKVLELPEQNRQILSPDKTISEVFKEVGDLLLILGEPGSGKTITLLELARTLINDAENNSNQPIPVIFNLSSWVGESLFDWLVSELSKKYLIPKKFSRTWLENQHILPLLDGLDETRAENRATCVDAINTFVQEIGVPGLAVCSRLQEYTALPTRLKLNGAICLQPLTTEQINDYLARAGSQLDALHHLLQTDQNLQTLAKAPVMLNVMSLAYHDLSVEEVSSHKECDTLEEQRRHLFDTYIDRMFKRKGKAEQPYTPEQTQGWLSWLAQNMNQHSQTTFLIENLQPSWLSSGWQRLNYALSSRLSFELIKGLLVGLLLIYFYSFYSSPFSKPLIQDFQGLFVHVSLGISIFLFLGLSIGLGDAIRFERSIYLELWKIKEANFQPDEKVSLVDIFFYGLALFKNAVNVLSYWFALFMIYLLVSLLILIMSLWTSQEIDITFDGIAMLGAVLVVIDMFISGFFLGIRTTEPAISNDIRAVETLRWSWKRAFNGGLIGVSVGIFLILIPLAIIFGEASSPPPGSLGELIITQSIIGIFSLFIFGIVFGGIRKGLRKDHIFPNQGIKLSIRNAIFGGLMGFTVFGLLNLIRSSLIEDWNVSLVFIVGWMLLQSMIGGIVVAMWYGGVDVIRHYTLRVILYFKGYTPRNYVHFLDYAAKLIFMRKVGGGYIFIHRFLLEHFAAMDEEKQSTSSRQ
jgi:eukaryotic-like serine/threonine-protein kinase